MRVKFKDQINFLFLKDVGKLLGKGNNEVKYIIIEKDNGIEVYDLPLVYTDYASMLYDYLAYDYDELDDIYKEKYKYLYKTIKKIDQNKYSYKTKLYKKKSTI